MKKFRHLSQAIIIFVLFYLIFPQKAYAYFDPGAGTYILQLLAGAIVGGIVIIKICWGKIINLFKKIFFRKKTDRELK